MKNFSLTKKLSALALFLVSSLSIANAENKLTIDKFFIGAGETTAVTVNLENDTDIRGLGASIVMPEGLNLVASEIDENTGETTYKTDKGELTEDFYNVTITQVTEAQKAERRYILMIFDPTNAIAPGSGSIVKFYVKADADYQTSETTIELKDIDASNNDGIVEIGTTCSATVINNANKVNLSASGLNIKRGAKGSFNIGVENNADLYAFDIFVTLPAGLDSLKAEATERLNGGTLSVKNIEDNIYRVRYANLTDTTNTVAAGSGDIVKLTVFATDELSDNATISVFNFKAIENKFGGNKEKYYAEDIIAPVTIDNTTGISGINGTEENVEGIWNVNGMKTDKIVKGVNIIKKADGSVIKVFKK